MKHLEPATWHDDVLPCWRRNANNAPRPNSDIWRPLPIGIAWEKAQIEARDIERLFLIGSSDFKDTFGTYRLSEIRLPFPTRTDDRHYNLPLSMQQSLLQGKDLDMPICVSDSRDGNVIIIDGCHRCLAHLLNESMEGVEIFLGVKDGLHCEFSWSHPAR